MAGKSQLNGHLNGTSMNIYENNLSRIWRQNEINRMNYSLPCRVPLYFKDALGNKVQRGSKLSKIFKDSRV